MGRFLYPRLLQEEGFSALEVRNVSAKHEGYLKKIGFRLEGDCYRLTK